MAHYAKIENNEVVNVIVAEEDYIQKLDGEWIQTSYNTHGGVHVNGGTPLRKNFAGIGYTYDAGRDAFIPPKPFNSWVLNEDTCLWNAPTPMPVEEGKIFVWNEETVSWMEVVPETE